ncbi:hypothetical protein [Paraburkholderia sp. BCC1884]|uniref:hypothetical protein n=1 Tax=Paraburkholderia sp. BCC1884 TaxID=2562668 RepID=UPI001183B44B|nr:hypothetical protein [Paraburkholderia sp. BCC1884]
MYYITLFLAGAFLCNAIPHLAMGLQGAPFPTPFAKPRGVGNSSPLINFLWGALNLIVGLAGLSRHPLTLGANLECLSVALGAILIGVFLASHFGKVRKQAIATP